MNYLHTSTLNSHTRGSSRVMWITLIVLLLLMVVFLILVPIINNLVNRALP